VLVSEWVDGIDFAEVATRPDEVRDRFAEIVYRFFYGTAREIDLALGDPHPGNYLLCDDGHVAFLDFGMLRSLPRGYLGREAVIFAAIREGDPVALIDGMKALGYLPGGDAWNGELMLEHMRAISWWLDSDGGLRLAPEDVWRGSEAMRGEDGGELVGQLRRMTLPPEALLLRRMEGILFQTVATLRACVDWGGLMRELVEDTEPVDQLGREHRAWLAGRDRVGRRAPGSRR
jgi:hypothetical protein